MLKILIVGIGGKMGKTVYDCLKDSKTCVAAAGVDKNAAALDFNLPLYSRIADVCEQIDAIIDFSVREAAGEILKFATEKGIPCVLATTGYGAAEQRIVADSASKIAVFQSGNMSLGVFVLAELAKQAVRLLGDNADIEIVEHHHNQKVDAPSGTALLLADAVRSQKSELNTAFCRKGKRNATEIGIHSVRGGTVVGKHEVIFALNNEVITLKHEAESKAIFALGAIKAAEFIAKKAAGIYNLNDLLG